MSGMKWIAVWAAVAALGLSFGCESDSGNDDGGGASGSYAGTWTGKVCGRGLSLVLNQNGTSLTGTYQLSDPTFPVGGGEAISGTVSSLKPPATVTLMGSSDRKFEITFNSYNMLSGGFFNPNRSCDVNATK